MESSKFVIKCGNFAVLVDLHVFPLGTQDNDSWFSPEHRKEVGSLIRDSVEQKVRQFQEARHQKIQPKSRKDLTLNAPLCLEGGNVRLAVYFMKRHFNLRCIVRQHYRELRVFPERVVVCASPPENAARDATGQSKSKYFSSPKDPLPHSTDTKRAVLQKIARQANTQSRPHRDDQGSRSVQPQVKTMENETANGNRPLPVSSERLFASDSVDIGCAHDDAKATLVCELNNDKEKRVKKPLNQDCLDPELTTGVKRRQPIPSSGEYVEHQKAKRFRPREAAVSNNSNRPSSSHGSSCSSHDTAHPELRLEEEVIPHGNNSVEESNQSGLAASLRGPSVKPVSPGSSISSRPAAREERRGSAPRTSRLRRLKKS